MGNFRSMTKRVFAVSVATLVIAMGCTACGEQISEVSTSKSSKLSSEAVATESKGESKPSNEVTLSSGEVSTAEESSEKIEISQIPENPASDFEYEIYNNYVKIKRYIGGSKEVSIPSMIEGKAVTEIGIAAFSNCTSLAIIIPNGVTTIEEQAFQDCTSLEGITIPDSVTSIGSAAFYRCTSLRSISIPDSVSFIGGGAFYETAWYNNQPDGLVYAGNIIYEYKGDMPANTSIEIEDGTLGIAGDAFNSCTNLESIIIPNGVISIGSAAFYRCTSLRSISIPDSVSFIGDHAFYETAWYNNQPDGLVYVGKFAYKYKGGMSTNTSIEIKDGTLSIVGGAFYGCRLKSITIPDSVTSIGSAAFQNCTSLESATIPNGVTSIGYFAFSNCTSLKSITIPNSVTRIDLYTFDGCTSLTSITIPSSVTEIGERAFGYFDDEYNGLKKIPNFTIYGKKGSVAETYAKEEDIKFVAE